MPTTMGVKLDETTRDRLKSLSETKQRSAHWLMREALRRFLDEEEALEARNREADAAWMEYKHTGQAVNNEAVMAWLDTWGSDSEQESLCQETKPRP